MSREKLLCQIMKLDEDAGLYETDFEKMRNNLTIFRMILETVMLDPNYSEKEMIVHGLNDLEEHLNLINKLERSGKS